MSGILRLESLTRGNTLKQGDKTPLKYRLFDADGEQLNIAGKSAKVRLVYPDFLTIGYEKDGLTVAQDDTVTFTIDNIIPPRMYHVEVIVDDTFIFPSRADEAKFTVDSSSLGAEANIIEVVGVDTVVRKAVDLINEDPSLIIDEDKLVGDIISNTGVGNIEEYYQQFSDVITELSEEKDYYSLPEIVGARRGYSTLAESLGNLSVNMINKNLGKLDQSFMTEDFLQQMAGDAPINAVPADESIDTVKLSEKAVTPKKTTFVNVSTNLYNPDKALKGYNVTADLQLAPDERFVTTEPIKVYAGQKISTKYFIRVAFMSDINTVSSRGNLTLSGQTFTVQTGTEYLMFTYHINESSDLNAQINSSPTVLPYEPYYTEIAGLSLHASKIYGKGIDIENTTFINISSNLYNPKRASHGWNVDESLSFVADERFVTTEFIEVKVGEQYSSKGFYKVIFYDINKAPLSRGYVNNSGHTFTVQTGTAFVRYVYHVNEASDSTAQINKSETLLTYEPYYIEIDGYKLYADSESDALKEKYAYDVSIDGTFSTDEVFDDYTNFFYETADNTNALFDALQTAYPNYITKKTWGTVTNDKPVYSFTFNPQMVRANRSKKIPKIVIVCGTHGHEHMSTLATYLTLKLMCEKWQDYPLLEALRFNAEIVVVPVMNPSGWDNQSRVSGNNVDLNRNFPTSNWVLTEPGRTYSGPSPASEPETQLMMQFIAEHKDADIFYDFHTFATFEPDEEFIWVPSDVSRVQATAQDLISRMTRKWSKEFDWVDSNVFNGYASQTYDGGWVAQYALEQGLKLSGAFEIRDRWVIDPEGVPFDQNVCKAGVEALVNWLLLNLKIIEG